MFSPRAAGMSWSGDFSSRSTAMKRLANCAATAWYNNSQSGGQITTCNNAATNSYWDNIHLAAADYHGIEGKRVAYRADQSCPPKDGFQYVKCFYVGGKTRGSHSGLGFSRAPGTRAHDPQPPAGLRIRPVIVR